MMARFAGPCRRLLAGVLLMAASGMAAESRNVPLAGGLSGIDGWRSVPLPRVEGRLARLGRADGAQPALRLAFRTWGDERRLLAIETPLAKGLPEAKALSLRYRLRLDKGEAPRLAFMAFEKGGAAWCRVGGHPLATSTSFAEARLPLASLRRAEFSPGKEEGPKWGQVEKVWLGLALDGLAEGTFEVSRVALTSEPFRPTQPVPVNVAAREWSVGKDPAARAKVSDAAEGPGGKPCLKTDFSFPGRRHMYVIPSAPLGDVELEGYQGLRFSYKAKLPPGIAGLLVCLNERGGAQYYADPAPPASDDWTTVTIPFAAFQLGNWSKDDNGRLDLDQIGSLVIGLHGTAEADSASGTVWAADIEFVP